ncbi:putative mitogen-activated protein kinase kinase kinase STE-STE11 family [Helianthus annuus]|nr:putative mitogen-activated protein kinase kinase kinase STE-STE11 family [Helianthus annuus]
MAVKSAEVSASGSIQKEKEVMDNLRGCPNVIKCFGEETTVGDNGQMVYNLLLEYGSGGTLADLVKSLNGEGLAEIENVLLVSGCRTGTGEFVAKIGDLGLAKRVNHVKKNRLSCYWRGTPMYLSPEAVINGVQEPPADIWAVGCIVFQMLTGKPIWFSDQDLGYRGDIKSYM